nr:hypothetical protein [Tanacetum cinerariifolium]
MAALITISSDASDESVTSIVSRVILFGTILTEILIVPDTPTDLPTTPELPTVSPFLCPDVSEPYSKDRQAKAVLLLETSSSDTSSLASFSSVGPSRKRSRSSATSISFTVRTVGVLSLTRDDLLPPRKRYRGTSAMHLDEFSYEGSPVAQAESDMDLDIRVDVETVTATAATVII